MNAQYKILAATIAILACTPAFASDLPQKSATRIEFNRMIDKNNADKQALQQSVSNEMEVEPDTAASPVADQKKVLDLVDVEVGVGEERPVVVDRRYNSVGEPVIDAQFSNVKVTLPDDQKADAGT
jgi:hypothetical protein